MVCDLKIRDNLTTVKGVVLWAPVHSLSNMPHGRLVELQWGDLEDAAPVRGTQRGTLTLHVQPGNVDELIAALRYFAPKANFIVAR